MAASVGRSKETANREYMEKLIEVKHEEMQSVDMKEFSYIVS
jgi:hypothetical protein